MGRGGAGRALKRMKGPLTGIERMAGGCNKDLIWFVTPSMCKLMKAKARKLR